MPTSIAHEKGNVYRVEMSGALRKPDLDRVQAALAADIHRLGTVRLLIVLRGFEGWASDPNWNDLTFYATHGTSIARIAIVGEERWRHQALMFSAAGLRAAPVEFFTLDALETARGWLSEEE
ncbi:MAG TPA: STAS/SEC14 domain-containing protein [Vicinamibacterales bacterium]